MQLSANPGKFLYLQWVLATSVGLALSLFLYFFVFEPAFFFVPSVQAIGIYLFRWPHLIIGIAVGIAQGLVVRRYTRGLVTWIIASTIAWTLAIRFGSLVFESTFNNIIKTSGANPSTTIALLLSELMSGILFGLIIGLAQWFALRSKFIKLSRWMIINILAWMTGLLFEGLTVICIALISDAHRSDLPAIMGFEHIPRGELFISALSSGPGRGEVAIISISLLVGGVAGAITGYAISPHSFTFLEAAIIHLKKQKLVIKLSSGFGAALINLGVGLSAFLAVKEFDALMLSATRAVFLTPVTGGGGGCMRNLVLQPERMVIKETESIPLYAKIQNDTGNECQMNLKVHIPDFDSDPSETSQTVSVPPDQTATLMWVITPKRLGTYSIGISNGWTVHTVAARL